MNQWSGMNFRSGIDFGTREVTASLVPASCIRCSKENESHSRAPNASETASFFQAGDRVAGVRYSGPRIASRPRFTGPEYRSRATQVSIQGLRRCFLEVPGGLRPPLAKTKSIGKGMPMVTTTTSQHSGSRSRKTALAPTATPSSPWSPSSLDFNMLHRVTT